MLRQTLDRDIPVADLDVMTLFSALNQTVIASLSNQKYSLSHTVYDNFDIWLSF